MSRADRADLLEAMIAAFIGFLVGRYARRAGWL